MKSPAFHIGANLVLAALALGGASPALADVKTGVDAWSRGDYATAVREWQPFADKGDADAQFNLAQAFKWGRGVPQDFARAELLYAKAAQQGHLAAADNYGLLLFQRGQQAAAMPYIRAASDRGDARAQYLLGLAYFNAEFVGKDWIRAYALESLASQPMNGGPGLPQAKEALAQMDKYIPIEDRQRAISLATELAAQTDANRNRQMAAFDLGTRLNPVAPSGMAGSLGSAPREAAPAPMAAPMRPAQPAFAQPAFAQAAPSVPAPASVAAQARRPAPVALPAVALSSVASAPQAPARTPQAGGSWKLQLGAFGVASNADAQWAKVKTLPELAGHARLNAPSGKVTRLLAAGYSEEAAKAACHRLSAAGVSCLAVRD